MVLGADSLKSISFALSPILSFSFLTHSLTSSLVRPLLCSSPKLQNPLASILLGAKSPSLFFTTKPVADAAILLPPEVLAFSMLPIRSSSSLHLRSSFSSIFFSFSPILFSSFCWNLSSLTPTFSANLSAPLSRRASRSATCVSSRGLSWDMVSRSSFGRVPKLVFWMKWSSASCRWQPQAGARAIAILTYSFPLGEPPRDLFPTRTDHSPLELEPCK